MKVVRSIGTLRRIVTAIRRQGKTVGFVPTMGYFHDGHVSLMKKSVKAHDITVVSLFVNPIQFGPSEDLAAYPRDLKRDAAMAAAAGVGILFVPSMRDMYPSELLTFVEVNGISEGLCGASRPGHFRGVATVVAKLLNIVQPDTMYLGQKDAQQVAVIKKMAADLNFPVTIRVGKTVREPGGLAMSSRNKYLSPSEIVEAKALNRALRLGVSKIRQGESDAGKIISEIKKLILEETSATIEYVSCVNPTDLKPVRRISGQVLLALAVRLGAARLIDNMVARSR